MLTPDESKIKVFKNGNSNGFKTSIPLGGQTQPIATAGERLEWKKAQKKPTKNIISETIKRITPYRCPCCTLTVWCPSKVASVTTSVNQRYIAVNKLINPIIKIKEPNELVHEASTAWLSRCMRKISPIAIVNAEQEVTKGHGDGVTK